MPAILPMRWWHIEEVVALERTLFPADAWSVEQFWQELAQDTRTYAVAEYDGSVVGYAGIFVLGPDSDLQTIAVSERVQGTGVGRELLEWALRTAASQNAAFMLLEVRADNARAIDLYRRAGFERLSLRRGYYPDGQDALIMRCGLK